ncbi:MAG: hypothetical protein QOC55_2350, partial [Thermoleophilaceae bacterium]|nr:hypothetical protein [Thermoleophilaceae bacterium]
MTITIDRVGRTETGTPARLPDEQGVVVRDGVHVHWERYGENGPAILLMPTWSVVHSRVWKPQVGYLARHFRVFTFDGRGNGLSDRPVDAAAYDSREFAADGVAVLDAAGLERACVAGTSMGGLRALLLADAHPERVDGLVLIDATVPLLTPAPSGREGVSFDDDLEHYEGWAKYNRHHWLRDYRDFLEFFFGQVFPEPHSTKQIEDCVAWGLDTTGETLILTMDGGDSGLADRAAAEAMCRSVRCPVGVVHGTQDAVNPLARGERVAELTGGEL